MKKSILLLVLLSLSPIPARAVDYTTIATVIEQLSKLFGDSAPEPKIIPNNDPCFLSVVIENLRGPYGNYEYYVQNLKFNDYWKGSLSLTANEGFVQSDRLQVKGTVQHIDEFCHTEYMPSLGPPLKYSFNIDLNNDLLVAMIDEQAQLGLNSRLENSKMHAVHWDTLTEASVLVNTFDKATEIGQLDVTLQAIHTKTAQRVPESGSSFVLSAFGVFVVSALSRFERKRSHNPG